MMRRLARSFELGKWSGNPNYTSTTLGTGGRRDSQYIMVRLRPRLRGEVKLGSNRFTNTYN